MEAVKIKLYQNMVNYRKEMSYGYVQTYPLPTPSMVRGMAHFLLDLREFKNLKISIQGNSKSVVTNMQKVIKFDRDRKARPKNPYNVFIGTSPNPKTALHGVMFVDQIVDMELVLHICFEEIGLNEKLLDAVKRKTVVLGRNEDIAMVDFNHTKMVSLKDDECDDHDLSYNIFVSRDFADKADISGTHYRLPFYYEPVKDFSDKRIFKFVDAVYVAKGSAIVEFDECLFDEDGDIAAFLGIEAEL